MNKSVIAIIAAVVLVLLGGAYMFTQKKSDSTSGPEAKTAVARDYVISVVYQGKAFLPAIEGFKEGLAGHIATTDNVNVIYDINDVVGDGQAPFDTAVANIMATKKPDMFFAIGPNAVKATMQATKEIPIIYAFGGDPAEAKFVASLQSSGNNLTGITWRAYELSGKRLEILKRIIPSMKNVLVFGLKDSSALKTSTKYVDESAGVAGLNITYRLVKTTDEFKAELAKMDKKQFDAVGYMNDPFFVKNTDIFLKAIDEKGMPTIFHDGSFARQGVLASYGAEYFPSGKQVSRLAKKIIVDKELPTNIPSEGTTKLTLVINEGTARKLGVVVPEDVIAIADEIIPPAAN